MTREELKASLSAHLPTAVFDETGEFLNMIVTPAELLPLMRTLRSNPDYQFDYLFCMTAIDWKDHFVTVYHLLSKQHRHTLVVKAKITDRNNPQVESVSGIWRTAEFHEREVYDLFGIKFLNHPDLRRIFLDEDWPGYPLRKDYVDENMIEL
ncbi:MAG: NADH-quinone oxidoreductase subunit C [Bacteroidota bacterium]